MVSTSDKREGCLRAGTSPARTPATGSARSYRLRARSGPNGSKDERHETPHQIRGHRRGRHARGRLQRRFRLQFQPRSGTSGTTTTNSVLTISNENGALWTCGFNPFNGSDTLLSVGFVYEPLVYVNPLQNGKTTPMLATSWSWGAGNKSLTFTIRQGVKFSDGTPLTAADVAYTFNLLKKYPALDLTGVWSVLSSVTQTGSDQVTMNFSTAAVPYFYYIADQTPIVPEHIWSKIANPVTYPDSTPGRHRAVPGEPVHARRTSPTPPTRTTGSRASRRSPRSSTRPSPATTRPTTTWPTARPSGAPSTSRASRPSTRPRARTTTTGSRPRSTSRWSPNLTNPLLSNVKVRQAISYAIDRTQVSTHRRVRLRAAREPGRHRHPDVLQLAGQLGRWPSTATTLRPGQGEAAAGIGRLPHGLGRHHGERGRARSCPSPSSTSATTPTGSPRCR